MSIQRVTYCIIVNNRNMRNYISLLLKHIRVGQTTSYRKKPNTFTNIIIDIIILRQNPIQNYLIWHYWTLFYCFPLNIFYWVWYLILYMIMEKLFFCFCTYMSLNCAAREFYRWPPLMYNDLLSMLRAHPFFHLNNQFI